MQHQQDGMRCVLRSSTLPQTLSQHTCLECAGQYRGCSLGPLLSYSQAHHACPPPPPPPPLPPQHTLHINIHRTPTPTCGLQEVAIIKAYYGPCRRGIRLAKGVGPRPHASSGFRRGAEATTPTMLRLMMGELAGALKELGTKVRV